MSYKIFLDIMAQEDPRLCGILSTAKSADTQGNTLRITLPSRYSADFLKYETKKIASVAGKAYGHEMNVELR